MSTELAPPPAPPAPPTLPAKPTRPSVPPAAKWLSTWFGLGLLPVAPGTMGTLGAVPLAYVLALGGTAVYLLGLVAVVAVGTWAAERFVRATGVDDDQRIVIDEVAGYLLTLAPVPKTAAHLLFAFLLFRLFDIWKPQPVRWVDDNLKGGIGVMADDLAAAIYAGLALLLLDRLGTTAWLDRLLGATG